MFTHVHTHTHTHTHISPPPQMPSYQATPAESSVSHVSSSRTRSRSSSSRVTQSVSSEGVLPYSSSTSSLSQVPPTSDSRASTLVDQEVGGVRGEEPQPVVLNSLYINGTGWASQVRERSVSRKMEMELFNPFYFTCIQLSSGDVWVQYNDGSQVKIQPSGGSTAALKYTDSQGKESR